jgi:hypothetical protein
MQHSKATAAIRWGESTSKSNTYLLLTIRIFPPSSFVTPLSEGRPPVILHCARPTRAFSGRALREHRGLLEPPFAPHAPKAQDHTGFPNLSFSLLGGGLVESPTARNSLTRPPAVTPRRVISPSEGLPILYTAILREWPRLPFTARIERAHSYRARSASKKGTWPLPAPPLTALSTGSYNHLTFPATR